QGLIAIELVFGDQVVDDRDDFIGGNIENGARRFLDILADEAGKRSHGALRRFPVAAGVQSGLGIAENVGGAGVGDGITCAVRRTHGDIVVGIIGLRPEELDLGIDDVFWLGKGGVGKAGNVGTARADIDELAVAGADHAAAGNSDHAHVERGDVGL